MPVEPAPDAVDAVEPAAVDPVEPAPYAVDPVELAALESSVPRISTFEFTYCCSSLGWPPTSAKDLPFGALGSVEVVAPAVAPVEAVLPVVPVVALDALP